MPFEEAREYVRKVGLKSHKEWLAWCKEGKRPSNIPSAPEQVYGRTVWVSWPDWLGYESVPGARPTRRGAYSSKLSQLG